MEELLSIVGFSFGASVAIGAVRSLSRGLRPALRDGLKVAFVVRDTASALATEARQGLSDVRTEAVAERNAQARRAPAAARRSQPRRIAIARD